MTLVVGLTGGIGTGKSIVVEMFAELGTTIIDADQIVHELQQPGTPLVSEIARIFGSRILDAQGGLNRTALGAYVFEDNQARERLNEIVHPPVRSEMLRRVKQAQEAKVELVLLDIPLLFETRQKDVQKFFGIETTILVYAPRNIQIERQMRRDGVTEEFAERRVEAQMSIEEKRCLVDHVIDNSGDLTITRNQVEHLHRTLGANPPTKRTL